MTWDISGRSADCKSARDGFDSHPRLQKQIQRISSLYRRGEHKLSWGPQWRCGQFLFWLGRKVGLFAQYRDHGTKSFWSGLLYQIELSGAAMIYDSQEYKHLVTKVNGDESAEMWRKKYIEASKEISKMKRGR